MSRMLWSNGAAVCVVLSLTLAVLGFATDHWIDFEVDTDALKKSNLLIAKEADKFGVGTDRNRGLLKECYNGNAGFLGDSDRKQSNSCAWIEYEIPQNANFNSNSDDYRTRIHLVRLTAVSLGLAMLLLLISFVCHVASGCCDVQRGSALLAGILCIFSFLLLSSCIVSFMVAFYVLEMEKVKDNWFFWAAWHKELQDATTFRLGWSLWVFVASIPLTLMSAVFFFVAYKAPPSSNESKQPFHAMDEHSVQFEKESGHGVEMHERDARSQVSSASGMGRVMQQQVYRRTIDPATGRELSARLNDGYSDDNTSHRASRYEERYDDRRDMNGRHHPAPRPDRAARDDRRYETRAPRSGDTHYPAEPRTDYNSPRRDSRQRDQRRYETGRDQYF